MKESEKTKARAKTLGALGVICLVMVPVSLLAGALQKMNDSPGNYLLCLWIAALPGSAVLFFFFSQLLHIRPAVEKMAEKP